jgi:hypothetical protein
MSASRDILAAGMVLAIAGFVMSATAAPHAWDAVSRRLQASGGAKVVAVQRGDVSDGSRASIRMEIVLSAKGSVRIERSDHSNVLVVRPDGGEILDHRHQQLVRLGPDEVRRAAGVWTLFLSNDPALEERALGQGRSLVVMAPGGAAVESVWVRLGADSLPARLDFGPDRMISLELSGWRFVGAPAASRFRLTAPAGYEVVEWP